MLWLLAQSFVLLTLSFALGLAVGYLWWVSRLRRARFGELAGQAQDANLQQLRAQLTEAENQVQRQEGVAAALRSHHDLDLRVIAQLSLERDGLRSRLASTVEQPVSEVA